MAVSNNSAQERTAIVAAGNNSVPWVMMDAGAPCQYAMEHYDGGSICPVTYSGA